MTDLSDPAPTLQRLGQRRNLTILFADLSDSTGLADAMEAEHYAALLADLRVLYQGVVDKHGGTVVRIQGDGMLAIFGHPQAREDDGRRATEAALELHEAVRQLRPAFGWSAQSAETLTLHSGIHAGLVLVEAGDAVRGRFELLGNIPNIAARLSDAAAADEILVSEETLGLQRHFFQTSERRALQLRGRAAPLSTYAVLGRAAIGRRFEASVQRGLAPLIGRVTELAALEQALNDAVLRRPGWASIRAAAGVGKTRLTEEFLRRAAGRDCQIHRGYCESYLSAEPLQPFLQMLRSLPESDSVELVQTSHPKARQDALLALFEGLAARGPQLFFIDDLQWADDASMQLLHRLHASASRQGLPLLLLTASRPLALIDLIPTLQIDLQPFTDAEAAAAVVQLLPRTDPFVAAEMQRHAGGNPLFIEELCHALAHELGALPGAEPTRRLAEAQTGSAWIASLIESRVARLPAAQAQLLRMAAVIGNVLPAWLLQRLSGRAEQDPDVLALAAQDFVFPGQQPGQLRFKHGLTRDVVYEAIGLHERQALHRRIATELRSGAGQEPSDELLAYHDGAAGLWEAAAHHAERAGDQALASSAFDRAKKQYRAALAALEHQPPGEVLQLRWISIAQRFGLACVFDASRADLRVLQHGAKLAHASGVALLMARADYWLGYVSYALGESRAGLAHCKRGLAAAEQCGDAGLVAQLRGTLGQLHAAAADYAPSLSLLDEAIAFQRPQQRPGRPSVGLAYSLACRAYVLGDQGHFEAAHAAFDEALSDVRGSNHAVEASIQGWRAAVLLWQGRWAEAQACAAETQRIGALVRSLFTFSMGQAAGAYGGWKATRSPAARQALLDATAWLAPRGGGLFVSLNHGWLAEVMVSQGDAAGARQHIAQALRRARQHDWIGGAMAYRAAARLAPWPVAQRYLSLARSVAARRCSAHEQAVTDLCAAEIARQQGQPAAQLLDRAEAAFEALRMDWHRAAAQALRLR